MADKSIDQLVAADNLLPTDLLVLQQAGMAKKLPGQVLLNWLTAAADGHGGIQNIEKVSSVGLVDSYRITLADTTTFDFLVSNGRGISDITKTETNGLEDVYTISFDDGDSTHFIVTNGAKGDKGDNTYTWIKYASQKPTAASHSFGDLPDVWIGIYFGTASAAPTDWQQYNWYQIKGEKGDIGIPASLVSSVVEYQASTSGTIIPSGVWYTSVPVVDQGNYLWTRTTNTFNTGNPIVAYSVSRIGIDGAGSVSSVAGVSPNPDGNVPLNASNIGAVPSSGGDMTGALNMHGQRIHGLNAPTTEDEPATKGYVDVKHLDVDAVLAVDGWEGDTAPYTQTIVIRDAEKPEKGILETDRPHVSPMYATDKDTRAAQREAWALVSDGRAGDGILIFTCDDDKPTTAIPIQIEVNR